MTAPKPLMSKAIPSLLGPSAPRFNPQAQKGDTESQWARHDPKHAAWLGRSRLSFQRDPGIIPGGNCLLSDFFFVSMMPVKNTTITTTTGVADLYLGKAVTFLSACALHLCPFNPLCLPPLGPAPSALSLPWQF